MGVEADALERLIGFGRELRHRGLNVGTGRIVTFCRSAAALGTLDRTGLYWAGRSSLISRPEDAQAFDAAFDEWFREGIRMELDLGPHVPAAGIERDLDELQGLTVDEDRVVAKEWHALDESDEPEGEAAIRIVASAVELLREKSFADLTEEERLRVARVIRRLAVAVPRRRTRRFRPAQGGARFDVRRTLRRSLRTHGEPFHGSWRDRGVRTRPLVLILDVSGSMSPYARALLQFAFAAMAAGRRVAVICSDGLERGEPELLRDQMARLRRLAHRVVWVNPLKGSPRYEPLARGMAGALPFVDEFLPGHNLQSLEELARALARIRAASARLRGIARVTPVLRSDALDAAAGAEVHLKMESRQRTGSFKFRGAFNRVSQLSARELASGVATYSSGNHGQAVALAARLAGSRA